jgi:hypothetical protein
MTKLKDVFSKSLLPLAEALGEAISALGPVFDLIGYLLIPIGLAFKYIGKIINLTITKPLERVKEFLSGIGDLLHGDFEKGFKKLGHAMIGALVFPIETAINIMIAGVNHIINGLNSVGSLLGFGGSIGTIPDLDIATMLVGDLGIDANGGPVVMSPKENGIFQGTKNDDVAMYPGATAGGGSTDMSETNALLRQLLSAMKTPVPVVIGDRAVNEIGKQYATNSSYKPAGSR